MGLLCDFCGEQRSIVYCRADAACLCLPCDTIVHSASALSRRHSLADSICEEGVGLARDDPNSASNCCGPSEIRGNVDSRVNGLGNISNGSSLKSVIDPLQCNLDPPAFPVDSTPELTCTEIRNHEICKGDHFYEDVNLDDVDLTFQNYEEFFGISQCPSGQFLEDTGIGSLFEVDNYTTNSNCQSTFVAEVQ
ncbi:zinc finger protein CONSTANS-LIKE 10-like [Typha latifolia]|uniref:zinc finger protein CONSTANS-LIKE 10-like n=1 Tax=Typha latifolia TaxID=4733 RepID=UPI003C2EF8E8